jgi:hypothetical protein
VQIKKLLPFIITADHHPARLGLDEDSLRARFLPPPEQLELTLHTPPSPSLQDLTAVRSGEL